MVSILSTLVICTIVLCASAKPFQATCTFDSKAKAHAASTSAGRGRSTRAGRGRGAARVGKHVKGSRSSRPALYGVKTNTIDVVIKAQSEGSVTIFVNGETYGETQTSTCDSPAVLAATLTGGDVVALQATAKYNLYGPALGLYAAIMAADGSKVFSTSGQTGWKTIVQDEAESGWMLPGIDDSDWIDLAPKCIAFDCNIAPFSGTGAVCTWNQKTNGPIAVRFVVPTPTPTPNPDVDCSCNEGACEDGTCHSCLFDQGDGRLVCYGGWAISACEDAGSGYTWCGY